MAKETVASLAEKVRELHLRMEHSTYLHDEQQSKTNASEIHLLAQRLCKLEGTGHRWETIGFRIGQHNETLMFIERKCIYCNFKESIEIRYLPKAERRRLRKQWKL